MSRNMGLSLKVICQLCGKTKEILTDVPVGFPLDDFHHIRDFSIIPLEHPFSNYEIWLCDSCKRPYIEDWDEGGVTLDWETIGQLVYDSLNGTKKEEGNI